MCPCVKSISSIIIPFELASVISFGISFSIFASWFPGIIIVLINLLIFSKKTGIVFHSVFVIDLIPDFISPSRISESGFVLFIICSIS